MTEALIENQHQEAAWVEVAPNGGTEDRPSIGPLTTAPVSWPANHLTRTDIERSANTCHCWRCGGGNISLAERGPLDRILARNLLRMNETEREGWLRQWSAIPNHGPDDLRALEAWIAIECGQSVPEPTYSPRRAG